ncbi:MAG: ATP-binding protein [Clostridiales Family XIII bacterium]|jgi:predicted AAA+ superfamily ATPase|nr:ATP-binding protein [Clostridiales Family XIII bacterium]
MSKSQKREPTGIAYSEVDGLILFDLLQNDQLFSSVLTLLSDQPPEALESSIVDAYSILQRGLIKSVGLGEISGNYLQDYVCKHLAKQENIFTRMAEKGIFENLEFGMGEDDLAERLDPTELALFLLADFELKTAQKVYRFDPSKITGYTNEFNLAGLRATPANIPELISQRELIHAAMLKDEGFDVTIMLAKYYRSYGCGIFESAQVFELEDELVPVTSVEEIHMIDLVGYDYQKSMLIKNTEALLRGLPANNMLLFGDSGTGKSSSIRALLHEYKDRGLKLISVAKERLDKLEDVLDYIDNRGPTFIIYIDDLSFEENENEYKIFKSIIEGRMRSKPANAIFVVTSNRRNIVKDVWQDRQNQDDVHIRDNLQEKRSLSDRFGIKLNYSEPTKAEYLEIVKSMAARAGLKASKEDEEKFISDALTWEVRHGGRSGRTARQFIDYRVGQEILEDE